jgi:predicted permease
VFEHVAGGIFGLGITMKIGDVPEVIGGARVSASYFDLFGVRPEAGRIFRVDEDAPGMPKVVVISHRLWTERFHQDPGIAGRSIQLDGEAHTILGAMPAQFDARGTADVFVPLALPPALATNYSERFLRVLARLVPGQTIEGAAAAATTIDRQVADRIPGRTSPVSDFAIRITTLQSELTGGAAPTLYLLLGAVSFVLLIACTNVANLLLARGASRARELAIRAALGAGRARLVRQLFTESLVLGLSGAIVGLGVAAVLLHLVVRANPRGFPRLEQAAIDWRVLSFTFLLGLSSCLIFGLLPAFRAAGPRVYAGLRDGGRFGTGGMRERLRGVLVAVEVALAITLLIGSGLLLRSAWLLQHVDLGFDPHGVFTARVMLPPARYPTGVDVGRAFARIRDAATTIPGVRSAALTTIAPLSGMVMSSGVAVGDKTPASDAPEGRVRIVSSGYFGTMRIALGAGRDFATTDDRNSPKVVVISETLARLLWPGVAPRNVLGQRLSGLSVGDEQNVMEVVGIAADVRDEQLNAPPKPTFYVPVEQTPDAIWPLLQRSIVVVLQAASPNVASLERQVRHTIADVDPSLPIADPHTMTRALEASQSTARMTTLLLSCLGGIALVLAMVGIYGVVSHFVGQRTKEIGVRMALGATQSRIWRFVAHRGLAPVGVGLAMGLTLSTLTTGALRGQLYGVTDRDPLTLVSVASLVALVALAATYFPARRAIRVTPSVALGEE